MPPFMLARSNDKNLKYRRAENEDGAIHSRHSRRVYLDLCRPWLVLSQILVSLHSLRWAQSFAVSVYEVVSDGRYPIQDGDCEETMM